MASTAIVIAIEDGDKVVVKKTVTRPETGTEKVVKIENLPAKKLAYEVSAYPTDTGTGVAQALGSAIVEIMDGKDVPVTITMNSTIDHIVLAPATDQSIDAGVTFKVLAMPRNRANEDVLILPNGITWTSTDANIAFVDKSGLVTGVKAGSAVITATEPESNKIATLSVKVQDNGCKIPPDITSPDVAWIGMPTIFVPGATYNVQLKIDKPLRNGPGDGSEIRISLPGGMRSSWVIDGQPFNLSNGDVFIFLDSNPPTTHTFSFTLLSTLGGCYAPSSVVGYFSNKTYLETHTAIKSH